MWDNHLKLYNSLFDAGNTVYCINFCVYTRLAKEQPIIPAVAVSTHPFFNEGTIYKLYDLFYAG